MKLEVKDTQGKVLSEVEVGFPVIEDDKGDQAVHDTVVAYLAAQRSGTACTKTKGEVAGSGAKPWRQKGTGRARAGSTRSPIWVGGGVAHGPRPRDFGKKVNKNTRRLALRRALSERLRAGDVVVLEEISLATPKTRDFVAVLKSLEIDPAKQTVQFVTGEANDNLALSCRNVQKVSLTDGGTLNTYDVLRSDKLVFTRGAFDQVQQRLNQK